MIRTPAFCTVFAVLLGLAVSCDATAQSQVPSSAEQVKLSFAPLVKQVAPSVVNIYTRKTVTQRRVPSLFNDPFFRRFFGTPPGVPQGQGKQKRVQNSLGSGVIVTADGIVVTNNHVIEGADEITVVLNDRREFEATIIDVDERTDLAILRMNTEGLALAHLPMGDSDALEVGDLVLAIGNPFGVGQTVTSGIVSALARTSIGISDLNSFIQTDAAINPGNSGGALVSIDGQLIGINTAIFSKSGGSHGIGFAIPSNMARSVIEAAAEGRQLVRAWLGAQGQAVTSDIAASLGLDRPLGVLINAIYPGGAADRAGLELGDIVIAIDGREIADPQSLKFRIATRRIGEVADLSIVREGVTKTVVLALQPPPDVPARDMTGIEGRNPFAGATVANLNPALSEELQIPMLHPGVVVISVVRRSPAGRLRLRPGDIILSINNSDIGSVKTLRRLLDNDSESWDLVINRQGQAFSLTVGP